VAILATSPAPSPAPWKSAAAREHFDEAQKMQGEGLYPLAIDRLQMALAAEPRAEIERALGECFDAMKQPVLAAVHFARFLESEPKDAEILNRLGSLQLKLGKVEDAGATFEKLKAVDEESARTGLMQVELKRGAREHAAKAYEKAIAHWKAALGYSGGDPRALDGLERSQKALEESRKKR
jgi:tetratricopeptide (TPR) repeat protein